MAESPPPLPRDNDIIEALRRGELEAKGWNWRQIGRLLFWRWWAARRGETGTRHVPLERE